MSKSPTLGETQASMKAAIIAGEIPVYSTAYISRIVEVLQSDFRAVHAVLHAAWGDEIFYQMTVDYLVAYPSRTPNIGGIGRDLSRFMATYEPVQELPFLVDLAELEWQICECFWAQDAARIDASRLAELTESTCFSLAPSVRLFEASWPVHELWDQGPHKEPQTPAPEKLLLYRDENGEVQVTPLVESAWDILQAMRNEVDLGTIFKSLEESPSAPTPDQVQAWFQEWTRNGVIH